MKCIYMILLFNFLSISGMEKDDEPKETFDSFLSQSAGFTNHHDKTEIIVDAALLQRLIFTAYHHTKGEKPWVEDKGFYKLIKKVDPYLERYAWPQKLHITLTKKDLFKYLFAHVPTDGKPPCNIQTAQRCWAKHSKYTFFDIFWGRPWDLFLITSSNKKILPRINLSKDEDYYDHLTDRFIQIPFKTVMENIKNKKAAKL